MLALADELEVRAELVGEPIAFPLVDVQQAERLSQLAQVIGGLRDRQQPSVRPQDAAELGSVARSERVQQQVGG
ncbi:MAG TPA: hypothetical protein VF940_09200 [Streptosporangiaceae bacterium]